MRGQKLKIVSTIVVMLMIGMIFCISGCQTQKDEIEAVKVGLLVPYTGVFASNGYDITRGMELGLDEAGWQAGGRKIELIKEDSEMNGQVGLQKTRRLIEGEKIDILTGVVSSTVAYAIRDYVVAKKIPFIITNAGATGLTREQGSKYIFRVSFCNGQYEYPMGLYAYKTLNLRRIVVMAPDYAAGHEKAVGFMDGFRAAGGEIVQEIYPELGTSDFGPYFTQIKPADAVFVHFSGNDSIRFVNQWTEFGMKNRFPLLSTGDLVDEWSMGYMGESPVGILSCLHYSAALDTPLNREFVANYRAKYKGDPNMFAEQGYVTARLIIEALNQTKGDTTDQEKFLAAIRTAKFEAPRGPFRFDPVTQNVIFNTYIRRTEMGREGKMVNTVIHTIPDVADYKSKP